jgi:hypothetical protein
MVNTQCADMDLGHITLTAFERKEVATKMQQNTIFYNFRWSQRFTYKL